MNHFTRCVAMQQVCFSWMIAVILAEGWRSQPDHLSKSDLDCKTSLLVLGAADSQLCLERWVKASSGQPKAILRRDRVQHMIQERTLEPEPRSFKTEFLEDDSMDLHGLGGHHVQDHLL